MRAFHTDVFEIPLPEGHRFPADKYGLLRRRALERGLLRDDELVVPDAVSTADLLRVHTPEYVRKVREGALSPEEERRIGIPWSPALVERALRSVGATLAAARAAADEGLAIYLGGGTHHAFPERGGGFCVFNDVPVALRALMAEGRIRRGLIVDADVHQGDGTAHIARHDPTIFAFSIHGAHNYPLRKVPGDLDVALPDGTGDAAYLEALEPALEEALGRSAPELAVYIAGADPLAEDRLGRLALTMEGLAARDRLVLERLELAGVAVAVVLGGGYCRPITRSVAVYEQTLAEVVRRGRRGEERATAMR